MMKPLREHFETETDLGNALQTFRYIDALEQYVAHLEQLHKPDVSNRASVNWFSSRMEAKLAANDHKGGWRNCELQYLSMRLTQERKELTDAIASKDAERIINECADIANFAMMIADLQLGAERHGC